MPAEAGQINGLMKVYCLRLVVEQKCDEATLDQRVEWALNTMCHNLEKENGHEFINYSFTKQRVL